MNGWQTIKKVREELSEAKRLAESGDKSTANSCMNRCRLLLQKYSDDVKGIDYGFPNAGGTGDKPRL